MELKEELKKFILLAGVFIAAWFLPVGNETFQNAILESLALVKWYAQEHVLLCLVPAFFIAGVIAVFISSEAVVKYMGAKAKVWVAYLVASVSGTILAVCSCTILPLFSGIYKRGAGLGPAIAFLYSGPAINILAIILTARILGFEMGIARIVGAVIFSIVIGGLMHLIYRKEESNRADAAMAVPHDEDARPMWQTALHFFTLVGILIFATWAKPESATGFWNAVYSVKWMLVSVFGLLLSASLIFILKLDKVLVAISIIIIAVLSYLFSDNPLIPFTTGVMLLSILLIRGNDESRDWFEESWGFAKQILPLLFAGVLVAGFLLGSPDGGYGIIPNEWIANLVGGNSLPANFFASVSGAFMYFATLTEIPIIQGLMNSGMGKGPALALLLAGPALSLPNMLVIRSVLGTEKTAVYIFLVIVMATFSGFLYGILF